MHATYEIIDWNLSELRDRIAKINRRAARLGCPAITLTEGRRWTARISKRDELGHKFTELRPMLEVTIEGESPRVAGYTLVATLDHSKRGGNVVRAIPGEEVPEAFRTADARCDHCGTIRNRKDTFLMRGDDGDLKQIGRQCIRDYFEGHDPHRAAKMAEWIREAAGHCGDAEDWGGGGTTPGINLDKFLALAVTSIRQHGWVSRRQAREDETERLTSTASDTSSRYFASPKLRSKMQREWWEPSEEAQAEAAAARAWAQGLEGRSDFDHNLVVLAANDWVDYKDEGLVAAMAFGYFRHLEEQIKRQRPQGSGHVGAPGERIESELTLLSVKETEGGEWGPSYLAKFLDADGNLLTWFASSNPTWNDGLGLSLGESARLRATVKRHTEFRGQRETLVSRVQRAPEKKARRPRAKAAA